MNLKLYIIINLIGYNIITQGIIINIFSLTKSL